MKTRVISRLLTTRSPGQTLAEFGVTSLVFLMLIFGIMEMAEAVNAYNDMSTAAREAARYAIVHSPTSANSPCPTSGDCPAVQTWAVGYAPFLAQTDVTARFTCETTNTCTAPNGAATVTPASQDYAVITITHSYPIQVPGTPAVNLSLSASSRMLVAQ